jgi:hypothetical protein
MLNAHVRWSGFASMFSSQNPDEQDTAARVSRSQNGIVAEIVG